MPKHMGREVHVCPLTEMFDQRAYGIIGHGLTQLPSPEVDKDIIWEGISIERSKILDEVVCVELHELFITWDGEGSTCFGTGSIGILLAWHNLDRSFFNGDILMTQSECL